MANKKIDNIINDLKEVEENLAKQLVVFGKQIYKERHKIYRLIDKLENLDYDVSITAGDNWTVEVAEPSKLKTNIFFYITAPQDPHVLLEKVTAKLTDLKTGIAIIERKSSVNDFSIYTHKLLDKYVRS